MANDKGIIFSGPMVRAIIEGRKNQTRRVIKPQPHYVGDGVPYGDAELRLPPCPYHIVSRLYVKETWSQDHAKFYPNFSIVYRADGYPSDTDIKQWKTDEDKHTRAFRWRSSMFMPRWASRITLEVADVRVQRVQDISEEDARAEGAAGYLHQYQYRPGEPNGGGPWPVREEYASVFESINGPGSWGQNPWVWAYTFKVLTTKGGAA